MISVNNQNNLVNMDPVNLLHILIKLDHHIIDKFSILLRVRNGRLCLNRSSKELLTMWNPAKECLARECPVRVWPAGKNLWEMKRRVSEVNRKVSKVDNKNKAWRVNHSKATKANKKVWKVNNKAWRANNKNQVKKANKNKLPLKHHINKNQVSQVFPKAFSVALSKFISHKDCKNKNQENSSQTVPSLNTTNPTNNSARPSINLTTPISAWYSNKKIKKATLRYPNTPFNPTNTTWLYCKV